MTEEHAPEPAEAGEPPARKRDLWSEIKEHKAIQWSVAYLGAALAVAQAQEILSDVFGWPNVIDRIVIITLIVGFPIALTIAWYHGHRALRRISVGEFSILAVLLLVGA